jgi:hypothetical protein
VRQIFEEHFDAVDAARPLDERSRWAARNIRTCRTAAQGYHVDACPNGHWRVHLFNSCKHRACPLCGATETERWLERQQAKALRCPHHQLVFTSPADLRPLWRWNRRLFTNLYFRAAWHTIRDLLASPRWLGALPGAVAVFQSWGDELQEHLHLHFIVTSGGVRPTGAWRLAKPQYLLPVPVVAVKFRGKFLAYLRKSLRGQTATGRPKPPEETLVPPPGWSVQQCLNLLNRLGRENWHVRVEPAYAYAHGVLRYAGRYIRRGPLSERRIRAYDGQRVTIAYAPALCPSQGIPRNTHAAPSRWMRATSCCACSTTCPRAARTVPASTACTTAPAATHSTARARNWGNPPTSPRPTLPTRTNCCTACSPTSPATSAPSATPGSSPSSASAPGARPPGSVSHETAPAPVPRRPKPQGRPRSARTTRVGRISGHPCGPRHPESIPISRRSRVAGAPCPGGTPCRCPPLSGLHPEISFPNPHGDATAATEMRIKTFNKSVGADLAGGNGGWFASLY